MVTERNCLFLQAKDRSELWSQIQNPPTKLKETWLNLFHTSTHTAIATTKRTAEKTSQLISLWLVGTGILLFMQQQHADTLYSQCVNAYCTLKCQKSAPTNPTRSMNTRRTRMSLSGSSFSMLEKTYRFFFFWVRKTAFPSVCENKSSRHDNTVVALGV